MTGEMDVGDVRLKWDAPGGWSETYEACCEAHCWWEWPVSGLCRLAQIRAKMLQSDL